MILTCLEQTHVLPIPVFRPPHTRGFSSARPSLLASTCPVPGPEGQTSIGSGVVSHKDEGKVEMYKRRLPSG